MLNVRRRGENEGRQRRVVAEAATAGTGEGDHSSSYFLVLLADRPHLFVLRRDAALAAGRRPCRRRRPRRRHASAVITLELVLLSCHYYYYHCY